MNRIELQLRLMMVILYIVLFIATAVFADATGDPFVGEFLSYVDDDRYYLKIRKTTDGYYEGEINVESDILSLSAKKHGKKILGEIGEHGDIYQFTATMHENGYLIFTDEDGESIIFRPHKIAKSGDKSKAKPTSAAEMKLTEGSDEKSEVFINRVRLDADKLKALEIIYQTRIEKGRYWYDKRCGAWGVEGGPTAGFVLSGLDLPSSMQADISGGGTGIFINGREIHPLDQQGLQRLFGITYQGHYWLDAQGNLGVVGGPAIVNIVAAIQASQRQQESGSVTHGYKSTYDARGTLSGGTGGSMYSGRTATGKSVFWYPGM